MINRHQSFNTLIVYVVNYYWRKTLDRGVLLVRFMERVDNIYTRYLVMCGIKLEILDFNRIYARGIGIYM